MARLTERLEGPAPKLAFVAPVRFYVVADRCLSHAPSLQAIGTEWLSRKLLRPDGSPLRERVPLAELARPVALDLLGVHLVLVAVAIGIPVCCLAQPIAAQPALSLWHSLAPSWAVRVSATV